MYIKPVWDSGRSGYHRIHAIKHELKTGLKQTYSTTKLGTKQSYKPKTTEIRSYQSPYVQLCCPSSAEPGFTACGGEVSLGLILLPLGGKHLFEKNAVILLGSPALFSANQEKEYLESLAKDIMVEIIIWRPSHTYQETLTNQLCPKFLSWPASIH